jgi:hypothetical protein
MKADPNYSLMKPATYNKNEFSDGKPCTDTLEWDKDVHFGINGNEFDKWLTVDYPRLRGLGARAYDISKRGGRTAEESWRLIGGSIPIFCFDCGTEKLRISYNSLMALCRKGDYMVEKDQRFFRYDSTKATDFCFKCNDTTYDEAFLTNSPHDGVLRKKMQDREAKIKKDKIRGKSAFSGRATKAYMMEKDAQGQLVRVSQHNKSSQHEGVSFSKSALAFAQKNKHAIHFHLDGLGDVYDILGKKGKYSHNVTGRELRHVWRHWHYRFNNTCVKFYNGFDSSGSVLQVDCPWEKDLFYETDYGKKRVKEEKIKNKYGKRNIT